MEQYEIDRIFTWLSSAIGLNKQAEKKYFYNKKEMLFFNVGSKDGKYYEWKNQIPLSPENSALVKMNISQLYHDDTLFLEIIKSDKEFNVIPGKSTATIAEYQDKDQSWARIFAEVQAFLKKNDIDVNKARLIE